MSSYTITFASLLLSVSFASAANTFISGSGSGSLNGVPSGPLIANGFPGPAINVDEYTGLEAAGYANSATTFNGAALANNLINLSFSQGVELRYEGSQGSFGTNFTFRPLQDVTGPFTFTLSAPSGWGPGFVSDGSGLAEVVYNSGLNQGSAEFARGGFNGMGFGARAAFNIDVPGSSFDPTTNTNVVSNVGSAQLSLTSAAGIINPAASPVQTVGAGTPTEGYGGSANNGSYTSTQVVGSAREFTRGSNSQFGFSIIDDSQIAGPNLAVTEYQVVFIPEAGQQILAGTQFRVSFDGAPAIGVVPEPSSSLLLGLCSLFVLRRRR